MKIPTEVFILSTDKYYANEYSDELKKLMKDNGGNSFMITFNRFAMSEDQKSNEKDILLSEDLAKEIKEKDLAYP